MAKRYKSRLRKQEEKKALRQTIFFSVLTLGLLFLFIFLGLPLLIRVSVFLGGLKTKNVEIEEEKKDTLAPMTPRLDPLPEATGNPQIKISGVSQTKTWVFLILNGQKTDEVEVDEEGNFVFENVALRNEENEIKVYSLDEAENKSPISKPVFIIFDNEEPLLEISQPQEGQVFYGSSNKAEIKGTTEKGAKVYINEVMTIVDLNGEFSKTISLSEGENIIKIKIEDKAGNLTEKELKISYYP